MRSLALLLAASALFLGLASTASAGPRTTAPGGYATVRVIVTDSSVTMRPTRVPRGATAIFLLSNLATSDKVFTVGDASLTHHRGTAFAVKLARNEQKRVLLYLTYRGPLPYAVGTAAKTKVAGIFWVT